MSKRIRFLSILLVTAICLSFVMASADTLIDELFGFSQYYFHYLDEYGRIVDKSTYTWGSESEENVGLRITKTDFSKLRLEIDASKCELYNETRPVLIWVHKADSIFDATKWTDINKWYSNKLSETFLLQEIEYTGSSIDLELKVPVKLNLGLGGLLNGGYYEVEFYGEGAIPEQLQFAYATQLYTLEELEEYMQIDMSETLAEYYNADSGFRPEKDGFAFINTDFPGGVGVCSGISAVTTAKYNGYTLEKHFSLDGEKYSINPEVSWYNNIFGDESIHDITFSELPFSKNVPMLHKLDEITAKAFPSQSFSTVYYDNMLLGKYLAYYKKMNNQSILLGGNNVVFGNKFANLENRWTIIDYVASYLRQGKAVSVNISKSGGGHTIVGYRLEQIDENTYRLYCYDNAWPDDYGYFWKKDAPNTEDLAEDGSFINKIRQKYDVYIDFQKTTKKIFVNETQYREAEMFTFDSSHTSCQTSTANGGLITFSLCKGDRIDIFDYNSKTNPVIAYKAFPVIKNDKTVEIRSFAFYQSGEVREITNSEYTNVKMDYSHLDIYKIRNSQITLTKDGYKFAEKGNSYIEAYVSYDNQTDSYGQIKVRIPIQIG